MKWLISLLVVSNLFFMYQSYIWQGEAVKQLIGTSDVERIYRKLDKNFTYTQAMELAISANESIERYRVGPLDGEYIYSQADEKGLLVDEHTILYFKEGDYWGSRVTSPPKAGPWLYRFVDQLQF